MKKIYSVLFVCLACLSIKATSFTVTISGFSYTNAALSVTVGDVITIQASSTHPLVQVDGGTWNANGTTSLTTGWGVKQADYTFTITTAGTIYYVCQNHASSGMKGRIDAVSVGLAENSLFVKNFNLFPNPATNKLMVNFGLTGTSNVNAKLINMLGQEVEMLIPNTTLSADNYSYSVDLPANLPNGAYFAVITSNDKKVTKKVIVSK